MAVCVKLTFIHDKKEKRENELKISPENMATSKY